MSTAHVSIKDSIPNFMSKSTDTSHTGTNNFALLAEVETKATMDE